MSNPYALFRRIIVLCAILSSVACTYRTGVGEEYAKSFPVSARADVHINVANAPVQVVTSDDPTVTFHVRYEIDGPDSAPPFSTRQDGDVIELRENETSHDWWSWGNTGVERAMVEVRMPKNADLKLQTSNGAIQVSSLNGNIRLHTSNGSINAESVGGHCELSTSNGRIQATGRFDTLDIHTSNGGVVARAEAGSTISSPWSIGTSNAAVDLALPTNLKADLDVATSNGGVQLALPVTVQGYHGQSHLHGALNGGGPAVSVHTSNGRIRVSGV